MRALPSHVAAAALAVACGAPEKKEPPAEPPAEARPFGYAQGPSMSVRPAATPKPPALPATPPPPSAEELEIEAARKACVAGNRGECLRQGEMIEKRAAATETSPWEALRAYSYACNQGRPEGCTRKGMLHASRDHFLWSPEEARISFKTGCDLGDAVGCSALAQLDQAAAAGGAPADPVELTRMTCDGGHVPSCIRLGEMYERGEGLPVAPERAAALYRKLCSYLEEDTRGCNKAAQMYRNAGWSGHDPVQAARYSQLACERFRSDRLGIGYEKEVLMNALDGCRDLGAMFAAGEGVPKDAARAAERFEYGCRFLHGPSCYELALLLQRGEGVERNEGRARELMATACTVGEPRACAASGGASHP